jgi:hypothetical protein
LRGDGVGTIYSGGSSERAEVRLANRRAREDSSRAGKRAQRRGRQGATQEGEEEKYSVLG